MQTTKAVLEIYENRGKEGKSLTRLYRQLFNPELYETAYSRIYANLGATTRGTSEETLDGMSKKRIEDIIQKVKSETYRWNPVRRTYIPKGNGKSRPLGIPSGNDKLLQAAMKTLLEAYYEPTFSDKSHGFRTGRGCHTALVQLRQKHRDVSWFIEGDIKGCFDNIDHEILMETLADKIKDGRFLRLIENLLKAGYMENWTKYDTYSGTPQGGIISPLLTNIYMDVFDKWVENDLMPRYNRSQFTRNGKRTSGRRRNPEYRALNLKQWRAWKKGDIETAKQIRKQMKTMTTVITDDEQFRKLAYIRYADDFLLSFGGPKHEAEEIKKEISQFLQDTLRLELSKEKTLITHARTQKANFLGYHVKIMRSKERKSANGKMWFGVPQEVIREAVKKYQKRGKVVHRPELLSNSDYDIIAAYQAEYRGLVQYYIMAHTVPNLARVKWATETSLLKTLAAKHKISVKRASKKYSSMKEIKGKMYIVKQVTIERKGKKPLEAYFGGSLLKTLDTSGKNPTSERNQRRQHKAKLHQ